MSQLEPKPDPFAPVDVDLKNPLVAALWAWLWPGAGHIYQQRYAKGALFMVCILIIYFWGLAMGKGHVVYASFRKPDVRWPYVFQVGVGLPALPAIVQAYRVKSGKGPLFGLDFMVPPGRPHEPYLEQHHDRMAQWHRECGFYFELGTLYTMIAGLLNLLAVYDAHSGPVFLPPDTKRDKKHAAGESGDDRSQMSASWLKKCVGAILFAVGVYIGIAALVTEAPWANNAFVRYGGSMLAWAVAGGGMMLWNSTGHTDKGADDRRSDH